MIIRHAEKPNEEGPMRGVTTGGGHNRHDLTVRGWQRAGALVRYFAPLTVDCQDPLISTPNTIIAAAAVMGSLSLRSQHTVEPLADLLELLIDDRHPEGDEENVALAALAAPSPVLIAWHHRRIPALVDAITVDRSAARVVGLTPASTWSGFWIALAPNNRGYSLRPRRCCCPSIGPT